MCVVVVLPLFMKKGAKLNKTKRGVDRVFTEPEQILAESKDMATPEQQSGGYQQAERLERVPKKDKKALAEEKKKQSEQASEDEEEEEAASTPTDPSQLSRREKYYQ